jgi:hypothetical protein
MRLLDASRIPTRFAGRLIHFRGEKNKTFPTLSVTFTPLQRLQSGVVAFENSRRATIAGWLNVLLFQQKFASYHAGL